MESDPRVQLTQFTGQVVHPGLDLPALPVIGLVTGVDPVGAGILADHQQFAHAAIDQLLGFFQHHADRPADQVAAHCRNDAEAAAMVAALRNLQVRVVPRRQLQPARRDQVDVGIVRPRQVRIDRAEYRLGLVRAAHTQHARVYRLYVLGLRAHTAGNQHTTICVQRIADGFERFGLGRIDKAAGIDNDEIGQCMVVDQPIALLSQTGDDLLGVHQGLGAAQTDQAHGRRFGFGCAFHWRVLYRRAACPGRLPQLSPRERWITERSRSMPSSSRGPGRPSQASLIAWMLRLRMAGMSCQPSLRSTTCGRYWASSTLHQLITMASGIASTGRSVETSVLSASTWAKGLKPPASVSISLTHDRPAGTITGW